jgi:hypothetical protein
MVSREPTTTTTLRVGLCTVLDCIEEQGFNELLVDIVNCDTFIVVHNVLKCCHPLAPSSFLVEMEALLIGAHSLAQGQLDHSPMVEVNVWKMQNNM